MILNAVPDGDEEFLSLDRYADKEISDYSTFILLSDFLNVLDWLSKHGKGGSPRFLWVSMGKSRMRLDK